VYSNFIYAILTKLYKYDIVILIPTGDKIMDIVTISSEAPTEYYQRVVSELQQQLRDHNFSKWVPEGTHFESLPQWLQEATESQVRLALEAHKEFLQVARTCNL